MIDSITLRNFRSYKKAKIVFHKGINVFTGTSGHGKTNIIRALNWVINNKPVGDRMRSRWGGRTEANIFTGMIGVPVRFSRTKGKNKNEYGHGMETGIKAFNQGVPDDIKKALNFSSLNLQGQHERPFLLALSGGEVAKYLNKIVRLDKIDLSIFNINKILRKENQDRDYSKKELVKAKEKSKTFDWIDEAEGCLVKLELFQTEIRKKAVRHARALEWVKVIENCDKEMEQLSRLTRYEDEVNSLILTEKRLEERRLNIDSLQDSIQNIELMDERIIKLKEQNEKNQKKLDRLMPEVCPLCGRGG